MFRFTKWLPCLGVLAGALLLGTASPARASIELTLTDGTNTKYAVSANSSDTVSTSTGNPPSTATVGYFSITGASGTSDSPGSIADGALSSEGVFNGGKVAIKNNDTLNAHTLTLIISAQGFTSPSTAPLIFTDTVSGTVIKGSVSGTAVGYIDTTNKLYGAAAGGGNPLPVSTSSTFLAAPTLSFAANGAGASFSKDGNVALTSNLPTPYSITFVETITVSKGGTIEITGGNAQVITPAPATMLTAFAAVPFLAIGVWLRRRKQAQAALAL